jgi:hypothetical protein
MHESTITVAAAAGLVRFTAWLAKLMLRTSYVSSERGSASRTQVRRRVLLLPRAGLNDDILNTLGGMDSIEVVTLPRRILKAIAAAFLPSEVDDNNYMSVLPSVEAAKGNYRAFLAQFWRAFDPDRQVEAVISGNFGYYAEREFAAALEDLGMPFIALHKENSWSPGNQAFWQRVYRERRGPFKGRRILVYSPIERDLQVSAGIVGLDRVEVVGMPRLDAVHQWRKMNRGLVPNPTVLFASFPKDVSMPVLKDYQTNSSGPGERRRIVAIEGHHQHVDLEKLCHGAHRAVLGLAASCPDITVFVKTKGRIRDREAILELLGLRDERELPRNMRLIHGGSPLPLLTQSAVVGGFHSTLLLEALAAGRPVVVPWFAEVLDPVIGRYVFDLGPAVTRASTSEEFATRLKELALARSAVPEVLPPQTSKVLREWLGNDDGRAGHRAATAILREIGKNRPENCRTFAAV